MDDLSGDQRLLLDFAIGISRGKVYLRFAAWKIWPMNQARWLTLAISIIWLCTRGAYPPEICNKLQSFVKFIVKEYAVSWFEIKRNDEFYNQQLYIFNMIQRIKQCRLKYRMLH